MTTPTGRSWLRNMPWWFRWIVLPVCGLINLATVLASCGGTT